jgi:hypothetical protein
MEIGVGDVDWIHMAQDSEHGNEPSDFIKCVEFLDKLSDY